MNYRRILSQVALVTGVFLFSVGLQAYAQTWSPPNVAPPGANAYAPLNTGPDAQTKTGDICTTAGGGSTCLSTVGGGSGSGGGSGAETDPTVQSWAKTTDPNIPGTLTVAGNATVPFIYDSNNSGYYLDPNWTSRMNYTVVNNINLYGRILGSVWVGYKWVPDGTVISCANSAESVLVKILHYGKISDGKIFVRAVLDIRPFNGHPGLFLDSGWTNSLVAVNANGDLTYLVFGGIKGSSNRGDYSTSCSTNW